MYTPTKPIVALFADIITKPEDKRIYHGSGANYINALATALGEHFGNVSLLTIPSEQHSRTQLHLPELAEPAQPIRKLESMSQNSQWEAPGV